ncbi:MAG TPA: glycosyltransferase family 9 protein [bacterium]|jgi:heptosyltransferase-3|nr:glycosyltransferase family 9 protein [bacterium]
MIQSSPRHILVSRTDKIGDLILSLPVFQSLRKAFPNARITALVSAYAKEVVQGHPAIDSVELYDPREGVGPTLERFKQLNPDVFIALYPRPKLALAARLAKIPIRIGTAFRWYSFLFNPRVNMRRRFGDRHEVEYNLHLLSPLGVTSFASKLEWPVTPAEKESAVELLQSRGIAPGTHYVVVHPGHKGSALNWSIYHYSEIIARLCQEKDLRVVVTGGLDETGLIAQLTSLLGFYTLENKPVYFIGECTLKQLAAVYQGADCFLSGSTGTMHIAAAVGTPTVALFCPIPETTPVRWGPWGNEAVVLMPRNLKCPDCRKGYCSKHDPMDDISEDDVFMAIIKFVRRARAKA